MTPEQQLQQLLTEAEQVTAKMREALLHLPDYQSKPKLATNYEEVAEAVKPSWFCTCNGQIFETNRQIFETNGEIFEIENDPYQLPTEDAAKQDRAFIQIKNLEAYCADRFEGERDFMVYANTDDGKLFCMECTYGIIKVTPEAAEWLIENHPEPFLVFYGVK